MSWRTWSYFSSSKTAKRTSLNFYKKFSFPKFFNFAAPKILDLNCPLLALYWIDVPTTQDGSLIAANPVAQVFRPEAFPHSRKPSSEAAAFLRQARI
jgi:hypothetical protein